MSGRGKVERTKPRSKSKRAGIVFPVSRVLRYLRKGEYAKHIGVGSSVFLSAVLEYLVTEILEMSGNLAKEKKRKTINPRFLQLAILGDEEFDSLLKDVTIPQGGVYPMIQKFLRPKNAKKKSRASQ